MTVSKRKCEHIQICLDEDVQFMEKSTGFEKYDFVHCALPEINLEDVDTQVEFLGKTLSFPLMISGMTGGYQEGEKINRQLAEVCQQEHIGLGLGSQRQLLDNDDFLESYRIARKTAPDAVIIGNIGAVDVTRLPTLDLIKQMVDLVEADGMAVHLNPLQEALQPEGNTEFSGVLNAIERLVKEISVPIIVKEVGSGISQSVAEKLVNVGVDFIDVAGAGGTSWAAVESYRRNDQLSQTFWDWGIPTSECILNVREIPDLYIIASGGISNGIRIAKALALGARLCGSALPILQTLMHTGVEALIKQIRQWREELRLCLFLTASLFPSDLQKETVLRKIG